jgi:hypothetical protein
MIEFQAWPKIPRWENEKFFYTEKIDGTNAAIVFDEEGDYIVQSRSRIIKPGDDNFAFALWCSENIDELRKLGPGAHFGEWWGKGIQRGYGLDERRFSLFNTQRWNDDNPNRPACVHVVPTIRAGSIEEARQLLVDQGSLAAPGYMNVEGVVMYAYEARKFYKSIINK